MANIKKLSIIFFFSLCFPASAEGTLENREKYEISRNTIFLEVQVWLRTPVIIISSDYRFPDKTEYTFTHIRTDNYKKTCGRWEVPIKTGDGKAYCSFRVLKLLE